METFKQLLEKKEVYKNRDLITISKEGLKILQKQNPGKDLTPYKRWIIDKISSSDHMDDNDVEISSHFIDDPQSRVRGITGIIQKKHITGLTGLR